MPTQQPLRVKVCQTTILFLEIRLHAFHKYPGDSASGHILQEVWLP